MRNALISIGVSVATVIAVYNYLPLDLVTFNHGVPSFGSTITTIQGTDTLSSSRSVINTNFSNLNTDKFETTGTTLASLTSAASLATVGTITSGTWNGTPVTVPYGGTASTTLSSNQILLGNGTSLIKTVNGFGTSGYLLTSNGPATAPTWQVNAGVDPTATFNWTGTNRFKTLIASTSITFSNGGAGQSYTFPTSRGASSSVLMLDASGQLNEMRPDFGVIASTTLGTAVAGTTTLSSIPAATDLHIVIDIPSGSTMNLITAQFNTDTGANYGYSISDLTNFSNVSQSAANSFKLTQAQTSGSFGYHIILDISNVKDRPKVIHSRSSQVFAGTTAPNMSQGSHVWNNTTAQINSISIGVTGGASQNVPAGTRITVYGSTQ